MTTPATNTNTNTNTTTPSPVVFHALSPADISSTCQLYSLTALQFSTLHTRSTAAKATAYCPYSNFRVGCTILTDDGEFIDGANVENAAYPVGTCAERVAFGKAVTGGWGRGGKDGKDGEMDGKGFKAVAVATDLKGVPASPCGMCRQFIREFCSLQMPIFMFDADGSFIVMRLEQLLPMSFGPEALAPPGGQSKPV